MNNFLKKVGIFSLIVLIPIVLELFVLPIDYFNYRVNEALLVHQFQDYFYGYFYPNQELHKIEVGDAGHHTKYAIPKDVSWKTDKLGFRNTTFTDSPEVIFVGDSQTAGLTLDQKDIISEMFQAKTNFPSYNISRDPHMSMYRAVRKTEVIKKPKLVVFQTTERDMPMHELGTTEVQVPAYANFVLKNRLSFLVELADRLMKGNMKNFLSARFSKVKGYGINSPVKESFMYVPVLMRPLAIENVDRTVTRIKEYQQVCKEEGIPFIIIPIPNKETIYYDYIPAFKEQPPGLGLLADKLDQAGIYHINLFKIFNEARAKGVDMYHDDDAHWNVQGVELTVDAIIKLIEKEGLLRE